MAILNAVTRGNRKLGRNGFTQWEGGVAWQWARQVRTDTAMLNLVLTGLLDITVRTDGELIFTAADDPDLVAQRKECCEVENTPTTK